MNKSKTTEIKGLPNPRVVRDASGGFDEPKNYQLKTLGVLWAYRQSLKAIMLLFVILAVIVGFEGLAYLVAANKHVMQGKEILIVLAMTFVSYLTTNQVYLVTAHGYQSREGQLHVDRLSSLEDCKVQLNLAKLMILVPLAWAIILLCVWHWLGGLDINATLNDFVSVGDSFRYFAHADTAIDGALKSRRSIVPARIFALLVLMGVIIISVLTFLIAMVRQYTLANR